MRNAVPPKHEAAMEPLDDAAVLRGDYDAAMCGP
jgi:hypothetical protein